MSSRQLRKLQKQRELDQLQNPKPESDGSDDEEPEPVIAKPRISLFAALGGDDNDDDDDDGEEKPTKDAQAPLKEESEPEPTPQPAKKNKKKKKKGKKKEVATGTDTPEETGAQDDEIERALKELSIKAESASASGSGAAVTGRPIDELLQIDTHYLKAIHEMRNLFGREAIDAATQEEQAEQQAEMRRLGRQGARTVNLEQALRGLPGQKLPEISLRRNVFIQGKDHWPKATAAGLTMKEVRKGDDGVTTEFTFHHDSTYDKIQMMFFSMVQMGEPMALVSLLRNHPYHITTLLQVSKVATQDQNASLAADLCERALFTFGRVTTSAFRQKMENGKARLDFKRPENREFWLAGYHYLKSLLRKGTYRTAFEWAKLLYSMNPNDPYAMKNFLHPLAMRAHQAQWLVDFCASPEHMSGGTDDEYMKQTVVLAHLQLGDKDKAVKAAVDGMGKLPWLYCALFQELNLDPPPPLWGVKPPGDSQFWTNIYINQAKDLWDNPAAITVLKEAVKLAQKVDVKSLPKDGPSDQRTARFAFLEGNTKLIAGVPRHILAQQPNYEFDPLPPLFNDNIFSSTGMQLPWGFKDMQDDPQGRALLEQLRRQTERAQQRAAVRFPGAGEDDEFGEDPFDMIPDEEDIEFFDDPEEHGVERQDNAEAPADDDREYRPRRMPGSFEDPWDDEYGSEDDEDPGFLEPGNLGVGLPAMFASLLPLFYRRSGQQNNANDEEEEEDGSDSDAGRRPAQP
ncbi:Nulp1-pending protein [Plectosphaerella plurivora]|uniref:Nulp1-pending protein n=1 Tax=Plectosphaerella plurivora TaxID=936078 RepID=A0A9P9ADK8_9PEZI|nr:Nulp1-pending protein [Plectosphaerella plurivora]